ncbi:MAG: hypothetical protein KDD34_07705 [Bdellovibrionales bacterium]|nr:hypothetical protein [Bdellovibrionales bacterium]
MTLFKMIEQYETELHLENLKLSPQSNAKEWLSKDLENFGSMENVIQHDQELSLR